MTGAQAFFSGSLTIVKALSGDIPGIQIAWMGFVVSLCALAVLAKLNRKPILPDGQWLLHSARGILGFLSLALTLVAVAVLPIPDVVAISFSSVLFLTVIAALALGEKVRWRRWTAVGIGFIGVVVMTRPGGGGISVPLVPFLSAVAGAFCGAASLAIMKHLTTRYHPITLATAFVVPAVMFGAIPTAFVWVTPAGTEWLLIALAGLLNVAGQQCMIHGFRSADASLLAPFDYSRLVFAGVLAAIFFSEYPDLWTLAGAGIIVLSTAYIARREARLAKTEREKHILLTREPHQLP